MNETLNGDRKSEAISERQLDISGYYSIIIKDLAIFAALSNVVCPFEAPVKNWFSADDAITETTTATKTCDWLKKDEN